MLLLQEIVQGLISKHSSLETFLKWDVKFEKVDFKKGNVVLSIERANNIVTVTINEPYQCFEFNPYPNTPKWGEVACRVGDVIALVYEDKEGRRVFGCKGYLEFKKYAIEFASKLESEDWLTSAKLVGGQESVPVKPELKLPKETFSRFQTNIHKILAKHDLMDAFYDPTCESVYLKLSQECYMDLVIERQYRTVFIGHYLKQNGDLISDPVLVFEVSEEMRSRAWAPHRVEQIFGDTQIMFVQEGKKMVYTNRLKNFKSFATMFAGNIKDQGWIDANVVDKRCDFQERVPEVEELQPINRVIPEVMSDTVCQMAFGF